MNDPQLKNLLSLLLQNKKELFYLLDYLNPQDIKEGRLILPQELFNRELKSMLLPQVSPYVSDYTVSFSGGMLFLEATLVLKQLGPLKAMLMLSVSEWNYSPTRHRLVFRYKEDVSSQGNPMQAMMLKALVMGQSTFLQKALSLTKIPALHATDTAVTVDLDCLKPITTGIFKELQLTYKDARDGRLTLSFTLGD